MQVNVVGLDFETMTTLWFTVEDRLSVHLRINKQIGQHT